MLIGRAASVLQLTSSLSSPKASVQSILSRPFSQPSNPPCQQAVVFSNPSINELICHIRHHLSPSPSSLLLYPFSLFLPPCSFPFPFSHPSPLHSLSWPNQTRVNTTLNSYMHLSLVFQLYERSADHPLGSCIFQF